VILGNGMLLAEQFISKSMPSITVLFLGGRFENSGETE
jgi:hypothetical protein